MSAFLFLFGCDWPFADRQQPYELGINATNTVFFGPRCFCSISFGWRPLALRKIGLSADLGVSDFSYSSAQSLGGRSKIRVFSTGNAYA